MRLKQYGRWDLERLLGGIENIFKTNQSFHNDAMNACHCVHDFCRNVKSMASLDKAGMAASTTETIQAGTHTQVAEAAT